MHKILSILLIALIIITACSSNKTALTTEEKLALADQLYAKGKYSRAAELYAQVYLDRISTSSAYALLREADCYFKINRFADAYSAYQEYICLLYTSDAADDLPCVDFGGRRILKKKINTDRYSS